MRLATLLAPSVLLSYSQCALAHPVNEYDGHIEARSPIVHGEIMLVDEPLLVSVEAVVKLDNREPTEDEDEDEHHLVKRATLDQSKAFKLHNDARKAKKVPLLKWDSDLAADALKYAKQMAKSGKFAHSEGDQRVGQGENLAYQWSSGTTKEPISQAVTRWLAEVKDYKNEKIPDGKFSSYGHYTQCMWNTTTRVGAASATDGKGAWYSVARYKAQGNIAGQKPF